MVQSTLLTLLEKIKVPKLTSEDEQQYYVKNVPNYENHYFGYTNSGVLCLLLSSKDNGIKTPMRLELLEVNFAVSCNMDVANSPERIETLTAIVCTSTDESVKRYFAHVCQTILNIVGVSPSLSQVADAVQHLVDLFRQLSTPARRSVIGLFGELYVIYSAKSPSKAVEAWRNAIDDHFDFSVEDVRLEIKSSGTSLRQHEFSLEQCTPTQGTVGVLASLLVHSSGGGLSLLDLVNRIKKQLAGETNHLRKLQKTIAESLGESITVALPMRFDESLARSSLQFYELMSIPAIRDAPDEVNQVRFRSNLVHTPVADTLKLASNNKSLSALLPPKST